MPTWIIAWFIVMKVGRNEPCPCGSGEKYKNCCLGKDRGSTRGQKLLMAVVILVIAAGAIAALLTLRNVEPGAASGPGPGRVWSEEHQHWH